MGAKEPESWQQVDSRLVFEHPRLSLVEDTVILPSGRRTEWLRFDQRRDFVMMICVNTERQVLLARQYCHPVGKVIHEFPGGLANEGESYEDAARRELMEEVGWYPHQLEAIGAFLPQVRRSPRHGRVGGYSDLGRPYAGGRVHERAHPRRMEFVPIKVWTVFQLVLCTAGASARPSMFWEPSVQILRSLM